MRFILTVLFAILSITLDAQSRMQMPVEFKDFVPEDIADRYFEEGADLSGLRCNSGRDWQVWSAIENNPFFSSPSNSSTILGHLFMCETAYVTDISRDWIELEGKGWVKAHNMILAPWALKAKGAVGRKALIVPNTSAVQSSSDSKKQLYSHYDLAANHQWNGRYAKRFRVLYIHKETDKAFLLSTSPKMDGTSASNLIRGWISKRFVTEWNRKVAYGPNYGQLAKDSLGEEAYAPCSIRKVHCRNIWRPEMNVSGNRRKKSSTENEFPECQHSPILENPGRKTARVDIY